MRCVHMLSSTALGFVLGMGGCYQPIAGRGGLGGSLASASSPYGDTDNAEENGTSDLSAGPNAESWPGLDTGASGGGVETGATGGSAPVDPLCLTNGAGGPATDVENLGFTDSAGRTSRYHVYASGVTESEPTGLLLYFHGDGANSFNNPHQVVHGIAKVAAEHNLMTVAMLTPNSDATWWTTGNTNASWVRELVQEELEPKYNIDRSRVLLIGYSGGAEFVAEYYTPDHHDTLCGGAAIIFGGGGEPFDAHTVSFDPDFVESFVLHWHTGQLDIGIPNNYDAHADSKTGVAFYQSHGFTVTADYPPDKDHYNLEFVKVVRDQLEGPWAGF